MAVSEQVRREDGVAIGQLRDDVVPLPRVARDPVNEQDHRPLAGRAVGNAMPVEDGFPDARLEIVGPASVAAIRRRGPRRRSRQGWGHSASVRMASGGQELEPRPHAASIGHRALDHQATSLWTSHASHSKNTAERIITYTERRRNRTFQPWGCQGLPVLKGWFCRAFGVVWAGDGLSGCA